MSKKSKPALTPTLVRQIARRVYALWFRDLRLEHERQRLLSKR